MFEYAFHEFPPQSPGASEMLSRQHDELKTLLGHSHRLLHKVIERIDKMSAITDRLTASVAALTTAEQSSNALLAQLSQMIRDSVNDPNALLALADQIDADTAEITAAVIANTPAAPTPPAPPAEGSTETQA